MCADLTHSQTYATAISYVLDDTKENTALCIYRKSFQAADHPCFDLPCHPYSGTKATP